MEKLSEMVEDGSLKSEFIHVESEHSALSCAMGASAVGARAFTATSSQVCYIWRNACPSVRGTVPIVMMNANRSTALPWNIYGDQRDSISQLDCGWIQAYAVDAQEALDLGLMSYYIAEKKDVSTPFMANLDGFVLTHTYEVVDVRQRNRQTRFSPDLRQKINLIWSIPVILDFPQGRHTIPRSNTRNTPTVDAAKAIEEAGRALRRDFRKTYTGLTERYWTEDADYILITLGSIAGLVKEIVDRLREQGEKVGLLRIRYLRPFPNREIAAAVRNAKSIAVLEKDISFGNEGTVYTNVNSALQKAGLTIPASNYIGGLGGQNISVGEIEGIFADLKSKRVAVKLIDVGGDET